MLILTEILTEWRAGSKHVKALESLGWKADSFDKQLLRAAAFRDMTALKKYWTQDQRMRQTIQAILNADDSPGLYGVADLIIAMRLTEMISALSAKISTGSEARQYQLANLFLQSRNETLYSAAKAWADGHGYRIIEFKFPGPSDRW